jgi:hypothetical protein
LCAELRGARRDDLLCRDVERMHARRVARGKSDTTLSQQAKALAKKSKK